MNGGIEDQLIDERHFGKNDVIYNSIYQPKSQADNNSYNNYFVFIFEHGQFLDGALGSRFWGEAAALPAPRTLLQKWIIKVNYLREKDKAIQRRGYRKILGNLGEEARGPKGGGGD